MNRTLGRLTTLLAVPVALASAAALTACAPVQTTKPYAASDGIDVTVGDVQGLNLLLVSAAQGEPGRLLGAFTNAADQTQVVTVAPQGAGQQAISVDAASTVYLSGEDDAAQTVVFDATDAAPGDLVPVTITVGDATEQVKVPVLDGTLSEYAAYLPTAAATPAS